MSVVWGGLVLLYWSLCGELVRFKNHAAFIFSMYRCGFCVVFILMNCQLFPLKFIFLAYLEKFQCLDILHPHPHMATTGWSQVATAPVRWMSLSFALAWHTLLFCPPPNAFALSSWPGVPRGHLPCDSYYKVSNRKWAYLGSHYTFPRAVC